MAKKTTKKKTSGNLLQTGVLVQVWTSKKLADTLSAVARKQGVSRAALVRDMLSQKYA